MKRIVNWPDAIKECELHLKPEVHFRTFNVSLVYWKIVKPHTVGAAGAVVVCTERLSPDGTYRCGFAFCSPEEPAFDRHYGQKIAAHRMCTPPPRPGGYYFSVDKNAGERVGKKLRELALVEAHRLCIRWMEGVQEGAIR